MVRTWYCRETTDRRERSDTGMLKRFSLYGFLKNQQYYDYFFLLALRQMGLSYFLIGVLIAFREVMVNILETLAISVKQASLRRLILESMGSEGLFKASKDYLQPASPLIVPLSLVSMPMRTPMERQR